MRVQNILKSPLCLSRYNMVTTSTEDRALFKKMRFHTLILDEAHMLKNMASLRYENLMKIKVVVFPCCRIVSGSITMIYRLTINITVPRREIWNCGVVLFQLLYCFVPQAYRRILLTGTPLQNNLVELMSILIFVMPQLFDSKKEELKRVFAMFPVSFSMFHTTYLTHNNNMILQYIVSPFMIIYRYKFSYLICCIRIKPEGRK